MVLSICPRPINLSHLPQDTHFPPTPPCLVHREDAEPGLQRWYSSSLFSVHRSIFSLEQRAQTPCSTLGLYLRVQASFCQSSLPSILNKSKKEQAFGCHDGIAPYIPPPPAANTIIKATSLSSLYNTFFSICVDVFAKICQHSVEETGSENSKMSV